MSRYPQMGMNKEALEGKTLDDVAEAIETVHWKWERVSKATNPVEYARAILELNDAIGDLSTWHKNWDYERGILWNEEDLEEATQPEAW